MKCRDCGTEALGGEVVCRECGADLQVETHSPDWLEPPSDSAPALIVGAKPDEKAASDVLPEERNEGRSAIERLLSNDRPLTIALVGHSGVGKSFYFRRLNEQAHRRGYALFNVLGDGQTREIGPEDGTPWEPEIAGTTNFKIYELRRNRKGEKKRIWIIDMAGEHFEQALKDHFRLNEDEQRRRFWLVLGAADAFMLMSPALESLTHATDDVLDGLSRALASMGAAIELVSQRNGASDLATTVQNLAELSAGEIDEKLREQQGQCKKPLLLLLSKADELRRDLVLRRHWWADEDPVAAVATLAPEVLQQLLSWFAYFKVDFVTACDGHDQKTRKIDLRNKPGFGVWESMQWARTMSKRVGNKRWAPLFRTELAYTMRSIVDGRFRAELNHG